MVIFKKIILEIFERQNQIQNIHKKAPNCTIFKNFLGGAYPRAPLAKRMVSRHANF